MPGEGGGDEGVHRDVFARWQDGDADAAGGFEVADVVRDDAASAGIVGELGEGFVVRVGENGEPAEGELLFLGTGAEGVEQGVNFAEGKAEAGGVALEDFLVFVALRFFFGWLTRP